MSLQGQVALVTGAGGGIGRAIVLALAQAGADVVAADLDEATARKSAEMATTSGRRVLALKVDVGEVTSIDAMVQGTVDAFGRLDIMVNNAGVTRTADIMDLTEADWDLIHRVNARGVFFCLQRAARQMIAQGGGRIINMASIAGRGYIGTSSAAYAASKGAVIAMTRTAAQQLGRHNINVNAICPGVTLTPMIERIISDRARQRNVGVDEVKAKVVRSIPIGRANEPEDIAAMAVFLASAAARNITGQAYNVDGGLVTS